jgi:hypothetical protein
LSVDGAETPLIIAPETGRIRFDLPQGQHTLVLALRRTAPVLFGEILSVVPIRTHFALFSTGSIAGNCWGLRSLGE